ncbi:hypothetical protein QIS74_00387 [Colletotrichum tabaci]|uniref:Ipa protein n=1 Tax=Colletotrichum tabaci TaxID=1209068 RepID=A0AAV9TW93_9PEZI
MQEPSISEVVRGLHGDLVRKHKRHGAVVEDIWRSFNQKQRASCVKAGMMDGVLLKHSRDVSLGNVYKIVPEWNLRDLIERPEHLLSMLEHRAKSSLAQQYFAGPNDGEGDYGIIDESMRTRGLRHVNPFKDCWTFFIDGEQYGLSTRIVSDHEQVYHDFGAAMAAKVCIPQATGDLVLQRQTTLLQSLTILIEDILEQGPKERSQKQRPTKSDVTASAAFSKLSIEDPPANLSLPDLVASAQDQAASITERLSLYSEPVVLAHDVNFWFFSRPELLPDEKGRRMGVHTDKYISAAVFDTVHSTLLDRLDGLDNDKAHRVILLQEISNVCQLAYTSAQALIKRHIQSRTASKWYKRTSNAYDSVGNPRVTLKGNPGDLTRSNPQLHYVLRLCHPDTTASKAVEWLKKLADLHQAHPSERENLDESETVTIPAPSRKKGQLFVSRSQELEAELNNLKTDLDLRDFAAPIDTLLEPGTPLPIPAPEPLETLVEQRKQKEKTRPSHSSAFEIGPQTEPASEDPTVEPQTFEVGAGTAEVFGTLFDMSKSRGAVSWAAFEGAMAELGFSVLPKYGSVFTFVPPETMAVKRPFTIHRPHKSQIEGYRTLIYARRLKRAYGWNEKTFKVA